MARTQGARHSVKAREYIQVATPAPPPWRAERWLRIAIVAGLFMGLAMSPHLWLSDRQYPLTPVFPFLSPIPPPLDRILYGALLATLAAIAVVARPAKWIGFFVLLAMVMACFDQSRWQPWLYQYSVMLAALGFYYYRDHPDDDHNPALNTCRLVMVCTYFWSGLQKAHTDFMFRTFAWLTSPFTRALPHSVTATIEAFGVVAPFLEMGIGIGLLLPRFRKFAIYSLAGMHAFILLCIGPLGLNVNTVVWPWNIAMCAFAMILFWNRTGVSAGEILWPRGMGFQKLVLLLFGIAPLLSFFDLWDGYLSSALYTDPRNVPMFLVPTTLADRLPAEIRGHVYQTQKPGVAAINVFEWSWDELNAPIYPEPRVYKSLARVFCSYAREPSDVRLIITRKRVLFSPDRQVTYDCGALSVATSTENRR